MTAASVPSAPASQAAPPPDGCLWPEVLRDELVRALARTAILPRIAVPERFPIAYADLTPDLAARVRREAPFFLRLAPCLDEGSDVAPAGCRLLAIVACEGSRARLLARDGTLHEYAVRDLAAFLRAPAEQSAMPGLDRLLDRARLPPARAAAVRAVMVDTATAGDVVEGFRLRPPSGTLAAVFRREGGLWWLALTALPQVAQPALLILAWSMVGTRAVAGRAGTTGLFAWVGVLAGFVAVRSLSLWLAGRLAIDGGRLFRQRLMEGLLALDAEPLRAEGIGQLLGRVMETAAVEALALGGGLQALTAVFELATGALVLGFGARGAGHLAILCGWLLLALALAARLMRSLRDWSELRLALTHDLVERMVGQRTLVAQQPPERRHREEGQELDAYERAGRALDRAPPRWRCWCRVAGCLWAPWLCCRRCAIPTCGRGSDRDQSRRGVVRVRRPPSPRPGLPESGNRSRGLASCPTAVHGGPRDDDGRRRRRPVDGSGLSRPGHAPHRSDRVSSFATLATRNRP